MGKGFAKSPRIVIFFGRKYELVVAGARLSSQFSGQSYIFFSLACLAESHSFG